MTVPVENRQDLNARNEAVPACILEIYMSHLHLALVPPTAQQNTQVSSSDRWSTGSENVANPIQRFLHRPFEFFPEQWGVHPFRLFG